MLKKYKAALLLSAFILILISTVSFNTNRLANNTNITNLTETDAIKLVKNKYPEFKDYPSNNLPPKTIKSEKTTSGWYLQFRQEGSGLPLLEAHCFFVSYTNSTEKITKTGDFKANGAVVNNLSISTCK